MSRVIQSHQPAQLLRTKADITAHLLKKVSRATAGLIGLEQEMFVTTSAGKPPGFDAIEGVLIHMASALNASPFRENGRVIGLSRDDLGDVCLEPGGQVELSSAPSPDLASLMQRQETLMQALETAAAVHGLRVTGAGHLPAFKGAAMMPRSRFAAYAAYCRASHGDAKAEALLDTMKSCTGLQVNVDPMGPDFHKIYRALMLVELAGSFRERTTRQKRFAETYAPLFPRQVTPLFNAVAARGNRELVGQIVDRLLTLHMPFVPDPDNAEGFLPSSEVYGQTPTVGELMDRGVLTVGLLDNALSLQMTMPNLRRHGVVETRAPDTPASMGEVAEIAARYHRAVYDPATRQALLDLGQRLNPAALEAAFNKRFSLTEKSFMALPLGSEVTVEAFIGAVDALLSKVDKKPEFKKLKGVASSKK